MNQLLAWSILAPIENQITVDYVRGLSLMLYYKPVQHAALNARGVQDEGRIVQASKVNAYSSLMLHSELTGR